MVVVLDVREPLSPEAPAICGAQARGRTGWLPMRPRIRRPLSSTAHSQHGILEPWERIGADGSAPADRQASLVRLDSPYAVCRITAWGCTYPEAAVDEVLKQLFDDHCTLRRYLVDEQFMSRTAAGVYWRAGGTVR